VLWQQERATHGSQFKRCTHFQSSRSHKAVAAQSRLILISGQENEIALALASTCSRLELAAKRALAKGLWRNLLIAGARWRINRDIFDRSVSQNLVGHLGSLPEQIRELRAVGLGAAVVATPFPHLEHRFHTHARRDADEFVRMGRQEWIAGNQQNVHRLGQRSELGLDGLSAFRSWRSSHLLACFLTARQARSDK
jgi:hypothetical protein